jgi:hypothetical protein
MKNNLFNLILILFLFLGPSYSQGNITDTSTYVIKKSNGVEYIGKLLSDDGREVLILTEGLGKIYIPKADIVLIREISIEKEIINNEYRDKGVFTTRYQFSTNAFPIEKGENYAMVNLYGPEVHFAVSKRLSIGVMATWIASPLILAAKYTIPTKNDKLNFGFGTLLGTSGYLNQAKSFGGLHWGMVSLGNRSQNITFSLGFSYVNLGNGSERYFDQPGIYPAQEDVSGNKYFPSPAGGIKMNIRSQIPSAAIIGIAGITPVGKKASFICDAMLIIGSRVTKEYYQDHLLNYDNQNQPDYLQVTQVGYNSTMTKSTNLILMPGMRFQKSETRAFQISLAGIIGKSNENSYSFPIPMCSWFFKF